MKQLVIPGLAAAAALAPEGGPPDAHDLRRPRGGDVVQEVPAEPARSGPYVPPFPGWRYQPVRAGDRLCAAFLAPRYVLANPRRFGLSPAGAGRHWIRYGDDLLLVDRGSRRVVRAVPGGAR
jgi:Ni/Co efflux regulator RcnB